MKKSLFITIAMAFLFLAPAQAGVTVEESTEAEYLINSGFSQLTAEDVFMQKNRTQGKPVEPLYEKSQNKFVRFCRSFYAYIDPSIDNVDRLHHDIKPSPSFTDL